MGIRIIKEWPRTASERAVAAWMDESEIDRKKVISYNVFAEHDQPSTIQLTFHFDEKEEE